jgi:hypothetical protein
LHGNAAVSFRTNRGAICRSDTFPCGIDLLVLSRGSPTLDLGGRCFEDCNGFESSLHFVTTRFKDGDRKKLERKREERKERKKGQRKRKGNREERRKETQMHGSVKVYICNWNGKFSWRERMRF